MNYYSFHIGDYRRDTTHLSVEEHYIYRTLIDWYFLDEAPIPLDNQTITRRLLIKSDWIPYLNNVLKDFFKKTGNGWVHDRIEWDIKEYKRKCDSHRVAGRLGGRPKKNQTLTKRNQTITKNNPNQEPLTSNHTKESNKEKATRLSEDFVMPIEWQNWYFEERPNSSLYELEIIFQTFKDYWIAKPGKDGTKLNWGSTWRNWVRREKTFNPKKTGKFDPIAFINRNEGNHGNPEKDITGEVVSPD